MGCLGGIHFPYCLISQTQSTEEKNVDEQGGHSHPSQDLQYPGLADVLLLQAVTLGSAQQALIHRLLGLGQLWQLHGSRRCDGHREFSESLKGGLVHQHRLRLRKVVAQLVQHLEAQHNVLAGYAEIHQFIGDAVRGRCTQISSPLRSMWIRQAWMRW